MNVFRNAFLGAVHLFYPQVCNGCGSDLVDANQLLCLKCLTRLPHTNFALHANNPIEKIFWGRVPLVAAHSEFYFSKESLIQHLIHQLKYKHNQDVGVYLGEIMGSSLLGANRFKQLDFLVPLPLFPEKERKRGFNQAAVICRGISIAMNVPVLLNHVIRQKATETQTKKHRSERWENVADSFAVNHQDSIAGKHLLLVDDVVTTGATLEACGQAILQVPGTKLSLATLAHATK